MTFKITSLTVYTRSIIQSTRWELQPRWWHPSRITSKKATRKLPWERTEVKTIVILSEQVLEFFKNLKTKQW
jgi:hypothetical protein